MLFQTRERCRDEVHQTRERHAGMGCIKQDRDMQGWGASNKRVMQEWGTSHFFSTKTNLGKQAHRNQIAHRLLIQLEPQLVPRPCLPAYSAGPLPVTLSTAEPRSQTLSLLPLPYFPSLQSSESLSQHLTKVRKLKMMMLGQLATAVEQIINPQEGFIPCH